MKNIQIIDGAQNCVYDIFAATNEEFATIFPLGTDIAFIDEIYETGDRKLLDAAFNSIWQRRVKKADVRGVHGLVFYQLDKKKVYYPTRRDEEAVNPDGSNLRSAQQAMPTPERPWPDDADGDVLRRLEARGFDFSERCLVDFNVDFASWPAPPVAMATLEHLFPSSKAYPSAEGGGYVQFQIYGTLTYELVVTMQRIVSAEMAKFGGICESWGVLD